jgi:hypothetical protein
MSAIVLAFALAMMISMGAAQKVSASTVDFTTSGTFASSGTNVKDLGSGASLTYDAAAPFSEPAGPFSYATTFGDFSLASGTSNRTITNDDITIVINQTGPSAGMFDLTGHLVGGGATLTSSGALSNGPGGSQAFVYFDVSHIVIAGIHYKITAALHNLTGAQAAFNNLPGVTLVQAGQLASIQGALNGNTSTVPVPAAAWGGMGLMALLAFGKLRRGVTRFV